MGRPSRRRPIIYGRTSKVLLITLCVCSEREDGNAQQREVTVCQEEEEEEEWRDSEEKKRCGDHDGERRREGPGGLDLQISADANTSQCVPPAWEPACGALRERELVASERKEAPPPPSPAAPSQM